MEELKMNEKLNNVKSLWFVEIIDGSMGCEVSNRIYVPFRPWLDIDYEKCLKKLWKRIDKEYESYMRKGMNVSVLAHVEDAETGEYQELSSYWVNEELDHMNNKGVLI